MHSRGSCRRIRERIGNVLRNLKIFWTNIVLFAIISLYYSGREVRTNMPKVVVKENEQLDDALRRFKRQVSRNGTLAEARKREFYVKPGVRRKLKSEAARKARRGK